ncbi:MAG: hypothetical protein ACRD82_20860, partial [Blastocatellia bacterium]
MTNAKPLTTSPSEVSVRAFAPDGKAAPLTTINGEPLNPGCVVPSIMRGVTKPVGGSGKGDARVMM